MVGRISFFVNAGIRFVEETCKVRAFTRLWDRICADRYGVEDPKLRRFRYGVQVNSLGLTEAQPENNVPRIVLEALGVTLSRDARARALQLPAWNEALGLPRPWDQQWSLRIQQILALETDLLEYDDIFEGSKVIEAKTAELADAAMTELEDVLALGGAFEAVDELKRRLVGSQADRVRRIETGELQVVGVNCFTETEPSPLASGLDGVATILKVDPAVEAELVADVAHWRSARDAVAVGGPWTSCAGRRRATATTSCPPPSPWPTPVGPPVSGRRRLRDIFGEYRAPTGITGGVGHRGPARWPTSGPVPRSWPRVPEGRPGSWWPSPGSTAIPTAPSRSPWPPATPASK